MTTEAIIRCGDSIAYTFPDGRTETWLVAYADYEENRLAWFGWPNGTVDLDKCTLVTSCTDEEHAKKVAEWLDRPHGRDDYGCDDRRVYHVRRLYRPEEQRWLEREARGKRILELEAELAKLRAAAAADTGPVTPPPTLVAEPERQAAVEAQAEAVGGV